MDNIIARSNNDTSVQQWSQPLGDSTNQNKKQEKTRTGKQYVEHLSDRFLLSEKATTTILVSGLTVAQDRFLSASLKGHGFNIITMDVPDNQALRFGKEFGNRGQCNPTYFTVGNLVKFLTHLRDDKGLSAEEIKRDFVYMTAGACGPCRFGTYVTEYRKALRDAGFDGFRVISASQTAGVKQTVGDGDGMIVTPRLFLNIIQALILGDVLNGIMYRIRPYEVNQGETNRVIEECRSIIDHALENRKSLLKAAWKCRKKLQTIEVDRTHIKPKVSIIGEFWAMTTEGDGNYKLQSFLESEGAEVDVQFITAWILYLIWQARFDLDNRSTLKSADEGRRGLTGVNIAKKRFLIWFSKQALLGTFQTFAKIMGLHDYHFPDMDKMAKLSQPFYDNDNRGGEGHMEVGKLILNAKKKKVNMTLSVKPFGCMPSSGVSDGVQTKITEQYPEAIFLPIETTGDGAVNVYSRIQMQLFKARQQAEREVSHALKEKGLSSEELTQKNVGQKLFSKLKKLNKALHHSPHTAACTTANLVSEL